MEMNDIQEVIIASSDIYGVYNAENGNLIEGYKSPQFNQRSLTLVGENFLCGALKGRPILKMSMIGQKATPKGEMIVPREVSVLTATNKGQFLFGGMGKELCVWKVTTGELLSVVERPYQEITCIACSSDDSHVLVGGKDGHVYVWMLGELVDLGLACSAKKPRFLFAHHTSEVTDIYLTPLGPQSRVVTASVDMTCRMYELNSGILISTICMQMPISAVTMDSLESYVFIGDIVGAIYRINIFEVLPREIQCNDKKNTVITYQISKILSLHMSYDGTKLISASEDNTILVLSMESLVVMLSIKVEGQLSNAFIMRKPMVLINKSTKPLFSIKPLKRFIEEKKGVQLQEAYTNARKISSMPPIPSELCYNPSVIHENVARANKLEAGDFAAHAQEKLFQQAVTGNSVGELTSVNNQLYSFMTSLAFDNLAEHSDSDMQE